MERSVSKRSWFKHQSLLQYVWVVLILATFIVLGTVYKDPQSTARLGPPIPARYVVSPLLRAASALTDTAMFLTESKDRNSSSNSSLPQTEAKVILWYNPPSWIKHRNSLVRFKRCPYSNCAIHEDRQRLGDSAAVMFWFEGSHCRSPPVPVGSRRPDQPWVFLSLESPKTIGKVPRCRKDNLHNAYNWSWNYRQDADIFNPYGLLLTNHNRSANIVKNYTAIYRRKKKFAAWLVSHCKTQGRREDYVKLLQRYVDVDVYGGCAGKRIKQDSYKQFLNTDYKFYLGFENSLCKDYITEKFFLYSSLDLVVVVRGGADYSSLLPHGTYVDTANFTTVKELADFLIRLGSNEEEYISYLRRKDEYTVVNRDMTYHNGMCQLCEKLNNLDSNRKMYDSIADYIQKDQCHSPTDIVA